MNFSKIQSSIFIVRSTPFLNLRKFLCLSSKRNHTNKETRSSNLARLQYQNFDFKVKSTRFQNTIDLTRANHLHVFTLAWINININKNKSFRLSIGEVNTKNEGGPRIYYHLVVAFVQKIRIRDYNHSNLAQNKSTIKNEQEELRYSCN